MQNALLLAPERVDRRERVRAGVPVVSVAEPLR